MNKRETVQSLVDSIQKGDLKAAESMLADDFQFSGAVPEPINKEAWLGMMSGTHSGSFDLTGMSMSLIPATDKTFVTKLVKTKITVKDSKVTSWAVEPNDGAGLMEILKQLDVKVPVV